MARKPQFDKKLVPLTNHIHPDDFDKLYRLGSITEHETMRSLVRDFIHEGIRQRLEPCQMDKISGILHAELDCCHKYGQRGLDIINKESDWPQFLTLVNRIVESRSGIWALQKPDLRPQQTTEELLTEAIALCKEVADTNQALSEMNKFLLMLMGIDDDQQELSEDAARVIRENPWKLYGE